MEKNRLTRRNHIAKDLRSPKYRMRVVSSKKIYNRARTKNDFVRELNNV